MTTVGLDLQEESTFLDMFNRYIGLRYAVLAAHGSLLWLSMSVNNPDSGFMRARVATISPSVNMILRGIGRHFIQPRLGLGSLPGGGGS